MKIASFCMELADYDYHLPDKRIAQKAHIPRDSCRLMILKDRIAHERFHDIIAHFEKGDILVLNNTKVLEAKMYGHKTTGSPA